MLNNMRKVSIKELHKATGKELNNLPFIITRRDVPIAQVTSIDKVTPKTQEKVTPGSEKVTPGSEKVTFQPKVTPESKKKELEVTPENIKVTLSRQEIIKSTKEKIKATTKKVPITGKEFSQPGLYSGGAYSKDMQTQRKKK